MDFRKTLHDNTRKTYYVIFLFLLIYLCVGLLLDGLIATQLLYPFAPADAVLKALITLQINPYATYVMLIIAGISLILTYSAYDKLMLLGTEYKKITPDTMNSFAEKQLYHVIEEMKIAAGLQYMPAVFMIEAPYMNAFASGFSEKSAMIAVTRGLAEKLNRNQLQAVIAHELSHIRHRDIKLTLTTSVLSHIMLMILDFLCWNILFSSGARSNDRGRNHLATIIILARWLIPLINIILMLYISRTREYMADAGAVELMRDNQALAQALLIIQKDHEENAANYQQAYQKTAHEYVRRESYIFDPTQAGVRFMQSINDIFSTHPSLKKRLQAIGYSPKDSD